MVHYIADIFGAGAARDPGRPSRLVRRHPAERRGDRPGVRPPRGREVRDARALRERRVGDLLHAGPACAAVQAGPAAQPRALRGACWTASRSQWDARKLAATGRRKPMTDGTPSAASDTCSSGHAAPHRPTPTTTRHRVARIVDAVAEAGHRDAERFAEWAVAETGMGVVDHKTVKNQRLLAGHRRVLPRPGLRHAAHRHRAQDRRDPAPRRGGARADPLHQPRRHRVLQGDPRADDPQRRGRQRRIRVARRCCGRRRRAARRRGRGAAGAPDGIVQVIDEPSMPLVEALMADERADVIVATGGHRRRARRLPSGNPALGVGPGNVPVLVDATADIDAAARRLVDSQGLRQLGAVHQRVGAHRGGSASRRQLSAAARPPRRRTCSIPTRRTGCASTCSPTGR